jgi:hypothetical protein
MASNVWTASERLYLTKDGRAVKADDPDRASLLVPAGGTLPLERARELGLVTDAAQAEPVAEPNPIKRAPSANKVKAVPAEEK